MEITIHTGCMDDRNKINIDWFDENGVRQHNEIEINVKNQDKPRVLDLLLDGEKIQTIYAENESPAQKCSHENTKYYPDPSGNSDWGYECLDCGECSKRL